jgi:hypothetical protein
MSTKLRALRVKAFTAAILVPAGSPDGTSLEEQLAAFFQDDSGGTERILVRVDYQAGSAFTALVTYTG